MPGEILPAQELLGDMLLAMQRDREALDAYGKAPERSPRRLNSLIGAARAAVRLGQREISGAYPRNREGAAAIPPLPTLNPLGGGFGAVIRAACARGAFLA